MELGTKQTEIGLGRKQYKIDGTWTELNKIDRDLEENKNK